MALSGCLTGALAYLLGCVNEGFRILFWVVRYMENWLHMHVLCLLGVMW